MLMPMVNGENGEPVGSKTYSGMKAPATPPTFTASPYSDEFILVGNEQPGGEFYFPSNKDGTFGTRSAIDSLDNVDGLTIGDFDNDGDLDFILGNGNSGEIYLYVNGGAGTFTPTTIATGIAPSDFCSQFRAADINNDGLLDFVGGDVWDPKWWFRNDGGGSFTKFSLDVSWMVAGGAIYALDVGDFDGDGNVDIVMVDTYGGASSGKVRLYKGDGTGGFTHSQVIDLNSDVGAGEPIGLAAGDFDNDGKLDIVIGGDGTFAALKGVFWLYKGDGAGGFTLSGQVFNVKGTGIGQGMVDAFDVDHNGNIDVIANNWNGYTIFLIKGNGDGTFQTPAAVDTFDDPVGAIAAPYTPEPVTPVGGIVMPFNFVQLLAPIVSILLILAVTFTAYLRKTVNNNVK